MSISTTLWRVSRIVLATATLISASSMAFAADSPMRSPDALTVGLHYVPPPFVGGTKVRTPESPDIELADALAARLNKSMRAVSVSNTGRLNLLAEDPQLVLAASLPDTLPADTVAVPTGYVLRPMAIMRTDTDIKRWVDLRGRTVCLSEGSVYVGAMAARYGAIELVHRAPADSLLALRIGECDAAVHDETMLKALLKLPEWKKFSASLPPGSALPLSFVLAKSDSDTVERVRKLTREWKSQGALDKLTQKRAQSIAFEVYLDQVVEDCH